MDYRRLPSFRDHQIERFGLLDFDVGAGGVEMVVVRDDLPGMQRGVEQDALGGAPLVRRDDMRQPVSSRTTRSNRKNDRLPAYDSSLLISAPHWADDIAPVPESVSRSIRTSSAGILKTLWRATASAAIRSSRVVNFQVSTDLMRNGSMMV
jgi:hypothetical protein